MRLFGLTVLTLVALLVGCDDKFATVEPKNPPQVADGLVFTRADGSSYEIKDAVASCFAARQRPGLKVVRMTAPADLTRGARDRASFIVEVLPGVVGTHRLPLTQRDWAAGPSDVAVLASDPRRHNELSGQAEQATGRITVREATCDPEPRLTISIDGKLGSESGLPGVRVTGGMASVAGD